MRVAVWFLVAVVGTISAVMVAVTVWAFASGLVVF